MLDISADALAVVQQSYTMRIRAESWLGDTLLADDIPVSDGTESWDVSLNIPEQVSLTVPSVDDQGTVWDPIDPTSPLAAYGQLLRIDFGVDITPGNTEWINRGWFLITSSSSSQGTVSVSAAGLLTLIQEAQFVAPFQPAGTLASTITDLIEPALTADIDGLLTDRDVPSGMQWDTDRLAALQEVLDAWPAVAQVTQDGILSITTPPDEATLTPVLDLSDTDDGTVVWWESSTSRDGAFNIVVAQGSDAAGNQIQGTAYDEDGLSPFRFGGPFSPLPVPYTTYTPLLTTVDQCRAAAASTLARLRRTNSLRVVATLVPHPGLQIGDVITVTGAGMIAQRAVIDQLSLPYSPGEMQITARLLGSTGYITGYGVGTYGGGSYGG